MLSEAEMWHMYLSWFTLLSSNWARMVLGVAGTLNIGILCSLRLVHVSGIVQIAVLVRVSITLMVLVVVVVVVVMVVIVSLVRVSMICFWIVVMFSTVVSSGVVVLTLSVDYSFGSFINSFPKLQMVICVSPSMSGRITGGSILLFWKNEVDVTFSTSEVSTDGVMVWSRLAWLQAFALG